MPVHEIVPNVETDPCELVDDAVMFREDVLAWYSNYPIIPLLRKCGEEPEDALTSTRPTILGTIG